MLVTMATSEPFYLTFARSSAVLSTQFQSRLHQNTKVSQPKTVTTEVSFETTASYYYSFGPLCNRRVELLPKRMPTSDESVTLLRCFRTHGIH